MNEARGKRSARGGRAAGEGWRGGGIQVPMGSEKRGELNNAGVPEPEGNHI